MGHIDDYILGQARAELRQGEVLFASGWMMTGGESVGRRREVKIRRFLGAATSQRLLVVEVKGSLMGGPATNAINKYWIEYNQVREFSTRFGMLKLAAYQGIHFTFPDGTVCSFKIPKMGRGMSGQPEFYRLLPTWLESHFGRGSFHNPAAAAMLAEETSNLHTLRQTYAPKLVGKPKHKRIVKWPLVLAVLAFCVAGLGFHLSGKHKDRYNMYNDLAAENQSRVDKLRAVPRARRTKKQADELERTRSRLEDNRYWAQRAKHKIDTSSLVSGGAIAGGVLFIGLAVVLQIRRSRAAD